MKILVCISHVPDTTSKIKFSDNALDTNGMSFVIGPYDDYALARAVELKESHKATVTAINVGKSDTEPTIRKALAIGADDAIRVDAEPIDAFFVATQIAEIAKSENYDLILMGREASDYNGGQVHGMVAEMLDMQAIVPCMTLDIDGNTATMTREIEGGKEIITCDLPFVAGCQEPIAEWKIPNMRGIMMARKKPLKVVEAVQPEVLIETKSYELPPARSNCKMFTSDDMASLVRALKEEAKVI
ncbi:MAG: electron transfer flavoprotein subunit beta/FixA family protein [Bernardetiaceae bacterium]|nr:electron transfer flavoprotein subunit beta/FixA family protein [Bernardetiaceae bacterium]